MCLTIEILYQCGSRTTRFVQCEPSKQQKLKMTKNCTFGQLYRVINSLQKCCDCTNSTSECKSKVKNTKAAIYSSKQTQDMKDYIDLVHMQKPIKKVNYFQPEKWISL